MGEVNGYQFRMEKSKGEACPSAIHQLVYNRDGSVYITPCFTYRGDVSCYASQDHYVPLATDLALKRPYAVELSDFASFLVLGVAVLQQADIRPSFDKESRLIFPLEAMQLHASIGGGDRANLFKFRLEVEALTQSNFFI